MGEIIKKRKQLTISEKLNLIERIDNGKRLSAVAREFGISNSTASGIVKDRSKFLLSQHHYKLNSNRKRLRHSLYTDIDEAVYMWFKQMRAKNTPVNGPLIQQKAREFAQLLGHKNFEGSSGWLSRFRDRHDMSVEAMRGPENSDYDMSFVGMTDEEIISCITYNKNSQQEESEYIIADVDVPELKADLNDTNKHSDTVSNANNNTDYNLSNDNVYDSHNAAFNSHSEKKQQALSDEPSNSSNCESSSNAKQLLRFRNQSDNVSNANNNTEYNLNNDTVYNPHNVAFNSHSGKKQQTISDKASSSQNNISNCKSFSNDKQFIRFCDSTNEVSLSQELCETSLMPPIKLSEAVSLVHNLTCFFKQQTDIPKNIWDSLQNIEEFVKGDLSEQLKQKKITDFFSKVNES